MNLSYSRQFNQNDVVSASFLNKIFEQVLIVKKGPRLVKGDLMQMFYWILNRRSGNVMGGSLRRRD